MTGPACSNESSNAARSAGSSEVKGETAVRLRTRPAGLGSTFDYTPGAEVPVVELPSDRTLLRGVVSELTLTAADGQSIPATMTVPAGVGPFPAVVIQHGLGGRHQDMFGLQEAFSNLGYITIAMDARGHGTRGTADALQQALTVGAPAADMLRGTVTDLRQIADYLLTRSDVAPGRIGFVGFSLGGLLGAMAGGADTRFDPVVLVDAGANWTTLLGGTSIDWIAALRETDPDFVDRASKAMNALDPEFWASEIAPRPVLLVRGTEDTVIPPESTDVLVAAAGSEATVVTYTGGHELAGASELTVRRAILNFVTKNLPSGASAGSGTETGTQSPSADVATRP